MGLERFITKFRLEFKNSLQSRFTSENSYFDLFSNYCNLSGPGLTNTITAVKNAQMAESPLLLIGGAAPTLLKGRGALQVGDFNDLIL